MLIREHKNISGEATRPPGDVDPPAPRPAAAPPTPVVPFLKKLNIPYPVPAASGNDRKPALLKGKHATGRLGAASGMLGVDAETLKDCLLFSETTDPTGKKPVKVANLAADAVAMRDAMVKLIYGRLFDHLLDQCNEALYPGRSAAGSSASMSRPGAVASSLSILDIVGFENVAVNLFDQLVVNLYHENVQHCFNERAFRESLELYETPFARDTRSSHQIITLS